MISKTAKIQFVKRAMELCATIQMPGGIEGHTAEYHLNGVVHAGIVNAGPKRIVVNYADFYPEEPASISIINHGISVDLDKIVEDSVKNLYTIKKYIRKLDNALKYALITLRLSHPDNITWIRSCHKYSYNSIENTYKKILIHDLPLYIKIKYTTILGINNSDNILCSSYKELHSKGRYWLKKFSPLLNSKVKRVSIFLPLRNKKTFLELYL